MTSYKEPGVHYNCFFAFPSVVRKERSWKKLLFNKKCIHSCPLEKDVLKVLLMCENFHKNLILKTIFDFCSMVFSNNNSRNVQNKNVAIVYEILMIWLKFLNVYKNSWFKVGVFDPNFRILLFGYAMLLILFRTFLIILRTYFRFICVEKILK